LSKPFKEIDHSGDIGIEVWGEDLPRMLANATLGLFSLVCRNTPEPVIDRDIRVESSSAEDLLVDWLSEAISLMGAHGEVYRSVRITRAGEWFAEGVLAGEKTDPRRHDLRFDVKAATYHGLSVEQTADGCKGRVIFDL
jgi:SHS2 domain-containing protein